MPTVETNGVETFYERRGEGLPVVFIHGLTLDHRMWRPQVLALEDDYETIAYDYRGHGQTGPTDREEYSIQLLVEDLRALLSELEVDRPVLCGHSYGGVIAAEYAIQYPDDVAGLVFADARTDIGETTVERMFFRIKPTLDRAKEYVGEERVQTAMSLITEYAMNAEQAPDEEVPELEMTRDEYSEACTEATPDEEATKLLRAGLDYVGSSPTDFHVPVLYAYGAMTGDVIADKAEQLNRAPADVRVVEIEGGGHAFTLEQPDAFIDVLAEFLGDVTRQKETAASDADD